MFNEEFTNSPYCIYPPRMAEAVDVTEQIEGDAVRYVVRNQATSRYFLLKAPEYKIFQQLDGTQTLSEISAGGKGGRAPRASLPALIKFLTKLDSLGLIAQGGTPLTTAPKPAQGLYRRIQLFNPNSLLAWLDRRFAWLLTKPFITATFVLMFAVLLGLLVRSDEVITYISYTYAEYGLGTIILFILTITVLHEFAHGWACKHFGGDVNEMGVLMIYYVMPAFYCNVSDIYRFGRKSQRIWVIAAGIYWQLSVSALAAFIWLLATPYTVVADLMFLVFLGGTFNIVVNCNPLIKLDGYYALSQALGVQNLQSQSAAYVRSLFARILGTQKQVSIRDPRPGLFIAYWLGSILYSLTLIYFILNWAGTWLMDGFGLMGVLLTLYLALLLTKKWWKPAVNQITISIASFKNDSSKGASAMSAQALPNTQIEKTAKETPARKFALRRSMVIKGALALVVITILITPWEASSGSDCTLLLPPGREGIARANTDALLAEIFVQQGDQIAEGAKIARLANPELEDKLTQINAEIQRLSANNARIEDELKVKSELMLSANLKETERKRLLEEYKSETSQIQESVASATSLPPSLAILQSEIELKQTELEHNRREVERYKKLFEQGLVGAQIYDRAVAALHISEKELQTVRARLEAAKVDHRRMTSTTETSSLVAETEARAARSNFEALISELHSNRQQLEAFKQRQEILQREYEGMSVLAPRAGVVLGEDLQKTIGRHYNKGDEICRIGELEKFQLKIEVNEREISSVRLDSQVRFKLKTVPGKTFTGRVSKINAEPIANQNGQRFYPVEVMVENSDGMLRPGMTGFARISFGRQSVGLILAEKLWQSLRPELWLF
jgi:putative peptide zinc metalloprotease protein